ncbi:hypothetical protein PT7_0034 [Pusillimonas sp. T7-7]|nr:hypothetical protein PT7_0034 [Pusillimonas sp. T7-7]
MALYGDLVLGTGSPFFVLSGVSFGLGRLIFEGDQRDF